MGQLQGKVALITGSGRGQGLAAAKRFAAEGAKIVINDLDEQSINSAILSLSLNVGTMIDSSGPERAATEVSAGIAPSGGPSGRWCSATFIAVL